jgi:hypothetical protein
METAPLQWSTWTQLGTLGKSQKSTIVPSLDRTLVLLLMAMDNCVCDVFVVGIGGDLVVSGRSYLALWRFSIACDVLSLIYSFVGSNPSLCEVFIVVSSGVWCIR